MFYVYLFYGSDKNSSFAISDCFNCFYDCLQYIESNINPYLIQVNIYKKGDNNNENYIRAKNDL